ncbi:PAS domain S-box protein [Methanoregula sp.]|uniref:PAS domain S-box protein n=1 Tax=Methanoregula sp. TaxID=2052170 RepID=UPI003562EF2B
MHIPAFSHNGDPVHSRRILVLIALTAITLGVNLFGMTAGLTAVLSHLLYFPVILASYWYPRRGLSFSVGIAAGYALLVFLSVPVNTLIGIETFTRMAILVLVGSVVAFLSLNLAESEQKLQDIIEFLPDPVFAIDHEGKVIAWNRAVEEMTGKPKAAVLGRMNDEYSLAFYSERRPMLAGLILKNEEGILKKYPSVRRESRRFVAESYLPHFHGERGVYLRFSATALLDARGNVTGAIESVRDISDQVMTESALKNTGNRLNTISGILRHDMSRILAVLYGQLRLGVMKFRDPGIIAFISEIKESANSLKHQIDISREFRDIGTTPPSWIPVQQAITEAAGQLDFGKTEMRAWTERLEVFSDPHLSGVFYHLLHNALKESTGVTNVIITYHIRDNGCAIVIEDNGTGIADAEKEQLFLQREDSFGRGLSLSHEILSLTGMKIRETGIYMKGARFEIIIPPEGYRIIGMGA